MEVLREKEWVFIAQDELILHVKDFYIGAVILMLPYTTRSRNFTEISWQTMTKFQNLVNAE